MLRDLTDIKLYGGVTAGMGGVFEKPKARGTELKLNKKQAFYSGC